MLPLSEITVIELGGLAPTPFCGMLLSDYGCSVIHINKLNDNYNVLNRGNKININLNIKDKIGKKVLINIIKSSDVLIDSYRPGVLESIGLGPDKILNEINPKIIYARITGYGQPKHNNKHSIGNYAGHDINFMSYSGILDTLPNRLPPINILGDFAAGGLLCAFGILMALRRRDKTNKGEVIDCSMAHGVAYISSFIYQMMLSNDNNILNNKDGGILRFQSHFYNTYKTLDGRFLAVGAMEPKFYYNFLEGMNVRNDLDFINGHNDPKLWPKLIERTKNIINKKTLNDWVRIFDLEESCVSPVLTMEEVKNNKLNFQRKVFNKGEVIPRPSPHMDGINYDNIGKVSLRTAKILNNIINDDVTKEAIKAGVIVLPKTRSNI